MEDQGRFVIGYYHQRQDFYSKKEEGEQPPESAPVGNEAEK
jgi:hypothetical protein